MQTVKFIQWKRVSQPNRNLHGREPQKASCFGKTGWEKALLAKKFFLGIINRQQ